MTTKAKTSSEHAEQCAIIEWARLMSNQHPVLDLLFAVPNGAKLPYSKNKAGQRYSPQAQKLKAEGMRAGVPDMVLPAARRGYHGLFIELKYGSNKPSEAQEAMLNALTEQGYLAVVCWGARDAIETIEDYLGI
jgi:hypothetical protein